MRSETIIPERHADIAPAFVSELTEAFSDPSGTRVFNPLQVGAYVVSIQASAAHRWCLPDAAVAPERVLAWEVMVTDAWDRPLGPTTHRRLFRGRPWLFHFLNPPPDYENVGRLVPTAVVQQLLDFLASTRSRHVPPRTSS